MKSRIGKKGELVGEKGVSVGEEEEEGRGRS